MSPFAGTWGAVSRLGPAGATVQRGWGLLPLVLGWAPMCWEEGLLCGPWDAGPRIHGFRGAQEQGPPTGGEGLFGAPSVGGAFCSGPWGGGRRGLGPPSACRCRRGLFLWLPCHVSHSPHPVVPPAGWQPTWQMQGPHSRGYKGQWPTWALNPHLPDSALQEPPSCVWRLVGGVPGPRPPPWQLLGQACTYPQLLQAH